MRLRNPFARRARGGPLALAAIGTALVAAVPAFADVVRNDVVVGGNDTIVAGGSTTITYSVQNTNSNNSTDPQNSCNPADGSAAVVTLTVPAGVTASRTTLTFTGCDAGQAVTFSSASVGEHPIGASVSDAGAGTYTNNASFTLTVTARATQEPVGVAAALLALPDDITAEATSADGATVSYTASATGGSIRCAPTSGSTFALGTTTVNCAATNAANAETSGSFTVTVRDTTAPAVTISPKPAGVVSFGTTADWTTTVTDAVTQGLGASCTSQSPLAFVPGSNVVTCSATDAANNTGSDSFTTQAQYAWSGVLQPINGDGSSAFKAGSTIPAKFRLTGSSAGYAGAVATIDLVRVTEGDLPTGALEMVAPATPTPGVQFRHDAADDQYVYNFRTAKGATGTCRFHVTLDDGTKRRSPVFAIR